LLGDGTAIEARQQRHRLTTGRTTVEVAHQGYVLGIGEPFPISLKCDQILGTRMAVASAARLTHHRLDVRPIGNDHRAVLTHWIMGSELAPFRELGFDEKGGQIQLERFQATLDPLVTAIPTPDAMLRRTLPQIPDALA
jgi:hypothetical protein